MSVPCFSSVEELRPIFDHKILISFTEQTSYLTNTTTKMGDKEKKLSFEIVIGTVLSGFKHADGGMGTDLEEEQKATLIHELLHVFHFCIHGQGFGLGKGAFGLSGRDYELAIDAEAYRITRTDKPLLRKIVEKLTLSTNCLFIYAGSTTPFLSFHKILVSDMLSQIAGQLAFVNPEQIKVIRVARQLAIQFKTKR